MRHAPTTTSLAVLLLACLPAGAQEAGLQPVDPFAPTAPGPAPAPGPLAAPAPGPLAAPAPGPLAAPAPGPHPAGPSEPIRELGGWLGEERARGAEPLQGPAAPADPIAPAPPAAPPNTPSPEEARARDAQIDRNYSDAQRIYQDVIDADPIKPLDRRIANNERIGQDLGKRIEAARQERRQLQVDLFNRTFMLKQQLEKKEIDEATYRRLLGEEERRFEERDHALKRDLEAWGGEADQAGQRLEQFKGERRILESRRPKQPDKEKELPPGDRLLGALQERLGHLGQFDTRHTLDRADPRDYAGLPRRPPFEKKAD